MRVKNPNPQDYPSPLELPFALLGKGQALADLYLPVRVNGDVAAMKGILEELFEREKAGLSSGLTVRLFKRSPKASKHCWLTCKLQAGKR